MAPLRIGDKVSFNDGRGGSRHGTVKAFNLSSIRAEIEVDGKKFEVDIAAITVVNGLPVPDAK